MTRTFQAKDTYRHKKSHPCKELYWAVQVVGPKYLEIQIGSVYVK